jgi:hypothetical protein
MRKIGGDSVHSCGWGKAVALRRYHPFLLDDPKTRLHGDGEYSADSPIQSIWWDSCVEKRKKPLEGFWVPPLSISLTAWNYDTPPLRPTTPTAAWSSTAPRTPRAEMSRYQHEGGVILIGNIDPVEARMRPY